MTSPYLDFFGETPDDQEAPAAAASAPRAPGATLAQSAAAGVNAATRAALDNQRNLLASANTASAGRQNLINSGQKQVTTAPIQWGLNELSPDVLQAKAAQATAAANARNGGLLGDLGRLGVGGLKVLSNPINSVIGDYLPEPAQAAIGGPGYFIGSGLDEAADQVIPGGSGSYGHNLIPGQAGTGGDQFYPSETVQSGSYADGYRGIGNPRANVSAAGSAGAGAAGVAGAGVPGRPSDYRTDKVAPEILQLLNNERHQGPSEAEALLDKATDRAAANSLGIAAGARGGAGARERATRLAVTSNVAAGSQASQDVAALRAREDADRRARQAAIVNMYSSNASQGDARDLGYYESENNRLTSENIAEGNRALERDKYNASQPAGLLDDPFGYLFNRATGTSLHAKKI